MPQTTIYAAPRTREQTPPPAVATHQLARLFGRSAALAGVTMRVEAGRTIALLGPNGAGKTTLLRILATSLRPSFGRAEIESIDIVARPDVVRRRVAYLSHATGLYDDLTGGREPGLHRHHALRAGAAGGGGSASWPRWGSRRTPTDGSARSPPACDAGWPLAGCC